MGSRKAEKWDGARGNLKLKVSEVRRRWPGEMHEAEVMGKAEELALSWE